jgi:hypothetical protein
MERKEKKEREEVRRKERRSKRYRRKGANYPDTLISMWHNPDLGGSLGCHYF